ncbi:MAG: hypothetical protein ACM31I_08725 [Deltaproteobacteria bacterium]
MPRPVRIGRRPYRRFLLVAAALLSIGAPAPADDGKIAIIVDGLPLDAKAIAVKDDVYVPAWILENYAHTKINWRRRSNLIEIITTTPDQPVPPAEGTLNVKIGFYLETEGFVVGGSTRLYLLNVDPKEFQFPDKKSPAERAHEAALDRIGKSSEDIHAYLALSPTDRFSTKGWRIVARMPKTEIATLAATVDKYEVLYKSLYYDLITTLVIGKEQEVNASSVIDDSMKGIRIESVPVAEDGTAKAKLPNGLYFLYGRMLYKNRQIIWDIPVSVRGGEALIELSNRNAALMQ